jgi:hypothetical protein
MERTEAWILRAGPRDGTVAGELERATIDLRRWPRTMCWCSRSTAAKGQHGRRPQSLEALHWFENHPNITPKHAALIFLVDLIHAVLFPIDPVRNGVAHRTGPRAVLDRAGDAVKPDLRERQFNWLAAQLGLRKALDEIRTADVLAVIAKRCERLTLSTAPSLIAR